MLSEVDTDADGRVDFAEFCRMLDTDVSDAPLLLAQATATQVTACPSHQLA